jgi:hypothetical protein
VGSCILAIGVCVLFKIIRRDKEEKEKEEESYSLRDSGDLDNARKRNEARKSDVIDKALERSVDMDKAKLNATKVSSSMATEDQ